MRDVADAVGVSQAAVSYAFNRPHKLSAPLLTRILDTAAELGYAGPHAAGRALRTGKVDAVGLILTDSLTYAFDDPGAALLIKGIAEVGELADVALTLLPAPLESVPAPARAKAPLRGLVDGFMLYALPDRHPVIDRVLSRQLPVVSIDGPLLEGHSLVGIDDRHGAREAAGHVISLGHRDVAILVSRLSSDGRFGAASRARVSGARDRVMKARVEGYAEVLAEAGIRPNVIIEAGGFSSLQAHRAAELLMSTTSVTAVLATTDVLALATLDVARTQGIRVPYDISVVGFDDLPAANAAGLTTVHQSLAAKGQQAARLLLEAIDGTQGTHLVRLPTELIIRSSTRRVRR